MDSKELQQLVLSVITEMKGEKPVAIDVSRLTAITDCFVVVTGRSGRHIRAIGDRIGERMRELGQRPLGSEGDPNSWLLVDCGDVVVHLMTATAREYYDLEGLWSPDMWAETHG